MNIVTVKMSGTDCLEVVRDSINFAIRESSINKRPAMENFVRMMGTNPTLSYSFNKIEAEFTSSKHDRITLQFVGEDNEECVVNSHSDDTVAPVAPVIDKKHVDNTVVSSSQPSYNYTDRQRLENGMHKSQIDEIVGILARNNKHVLGLGTIGQRILCIDAIKACYEHCGAKNFELSLNALSESNLAGTDYCIRGNIVRGVAEACREIGYCGTHIVDKNKLVIAINNANVLEKAHMTNKGSKRKITVGNYHVIKKSVVNEYYKL